MISMFKKFDTDLYEKLEQLKEQSAPPEEDKPEEEYDPELEKRIERLDRMFDRMNSFFDFAEDAVDMIGDGISSLFGVNDDDDEQPNYERFAMSENGYDPAMTDEFFDELEHKILYKLDPAYKELFTNGIEAKPYDFKAEDEIFKVLPETENGYNKSAVKEYYKNIKTMAAERWNAE